ncbi:iron-sulfur cluster assembly protein [Skeletonema marinoi]|uniref:Iron-sulfur cluster assembly protein n=1 Tax=Skeletonema marinoi TaxID=267567 RepID=A0AAD8YFU4_9STRA|nr:iron-sulfur cluster assembly protein [Skeletonema marinoi]
MMTILINSIQRTLILRHSFIPLLNNGSKCRSNRLYSAVSTASSQTASTTAGMQLVTTEQSIHHQPLNSNINLTILKDPVCRSNMLSTYRSMVTVTQTSASQKDDTPPLLNNPSSSSDDELAPSTDGELAITSSCAARIRQLASTRPNPDQVYLRLYVDAGGCSGFQYKFLLLSEDNDDGTNNIESQDDEEEEDGTIDPEEDIIFLKDGMRVVIDQTSLDLLRGSTIDYVQEMIRSSFAVVGNPQSESACGCGSSFAVKNFESNPALD